MIFRMTFRMTLRITLRVTLRMAFKNGISGPGQVHLTLVSDDNVNVTH